MNLLENYIVEIHSVEKVPMREWMNEPFLKVDITIDCYGRIERKTDIFPSSYWEEAKANGFYMG